MRAYNHYLVFLDHCRWNGASGYKIFDDLDSALNCRGYDFDTDDDAWFAKPKYIARKEWHHDRPTGHWVAIVGLSQREYAKLKWACFDTVEAFAMPYISIAKEEYSCSH